MRTLFFVVIIAASTLLMTANLALSEDDCDRCGAYEQAVEAGTVSFSGALSCFYLEQDYRQSVPMFIYDGEGNLINASPEDARLPRQNHRKVKDARDSYCVGAHFIAEALATGGGVEFCNDNWSSARIEGDALQAYLDSGSAPQTLATTVCLMDGAECDERLSEMGVPD